MGRALRMMCLIAGAGAEYKGGAWQYGTVQNHSGDGGPACSRLKPKLKFADDHAFLKEVDNKAKEIANAEIQRLETAIGPELIREWKEKIQNVDGPSIDDSGAVLVLHGTKGWVRSTHRDQVMSPISAHWFERAGKNTLPDQYMVFPEYKIAILLNHGRRIVWNGWLIHGCTDCEPGSIDDRFSLAIIQTRKTWTMLERMQQDMEKGEKMPPARKKYTPKAT